MSVVFLYYDKCQNYKGIYRKHTAREEDCENRWKHLLPNIERWNQNLLVERALEMYSGKKRIK